MKNLSGPLFMALFISTAGPALAQVTLENSTHKEYRQYKSGKVVYRGGNYDVNLTDGNGLYWAGCETSFYYPPADILALGCGIGSTGFVTFGNVYEGQLDTTPYLSIFDVAPARVVEPRHPELCILHAAPKSKLPRPSKDFIDDSYGVYYNLHTNYIREYVITRYRQSRDYGKKKRVRFAEEIVPGSYHYKFPRLDEPGLLATVASPIYAMPEGHLKKRKRWYGVNYTNTNSWRGGFMTLGIWKPNTITWEGIDFTNTFAAVDSLYFSFRYMKDERNPRSKVVYSNPYGESPASIFPAFVTGEEPRILLKSVVEQKFTLPPIFPAGTKGVIELEIERAFQTGGVTYDNSTRRFQLPVMVLNRYSEYRDLRFPNGGKKTSLLDDFDLDGYNNMTEWILDSLADDPVSVPDQLTTEDHPAVVDNTWGYIWWTMEPQYFGFSVLLKEATNPKVKQTLQRSKDLGKTWRTFRSDLDWDVNRDFPDIRVESKVSVDDPDNPGQLIQVQPPGTETDLYRIKVTRKKKKKKK
jgi:hypothetical protein